jgi:signal transduction histidine kinase
MKPLRAILVEDVENDALLIQRSLRHGGYDLVTTTVRDGATLSAALTAGEWDVVISDYSLPGFSALRALEIVRSIAGEDLPFIVVSGSVGEESAVEALKAGAGDFIVKSNLDRLLTALDRELRDAQTRRERQAAVQALEEAVHVRDEFLAIASHELRTPLTSLQLQLQRMDRALTGGGDWAGALPSETVTALRNRFDAIARSADRMQGLVERLLDVTRLTTGSRMELVPEQVDLTEVARLSVKRALAGPPASNVPVTIAAPGPVIGFWDRDRIETVVRNLVDNAIKYSNGLPVDITLERTEGDGARLIVVDRGVGIPPEAQRRIFERFERAVPIRHFGGFGLGLWLSRKIVEAHGGRIAVCSEPGEGSTFTLDLPRQVPSADAAVGR